MTSLTEIADNHIGFGWYMRRCPQASKISDFYGGVVRLPLIRGRDPVWFYWAGETHIFELKSDVPPKPHRDNDPSSAPCVPIFRTHGLADYLERLTRGGAQLVSDTGAGDTREVFVLDPDSQLIGFRERSRSSMAPGDADAWRRRDRGEDFNPGCSPMPTYLQDLSWVLRRVSDVPAATAFYRDVIGFTYLGDYDDRAVFDLKNGVMLELAPGGKSAATPPTREEITNTWVHRVADHDLMNGWLKDKGAPLVNDKIQFNSAELTYVADPDGAITGFEERYDPSRFRQPREPFLEDLEADRRYFGS